MKRKSTLLSARSLFQLLLLIIILFSSIGAHAQTIYVHVTAGGANNGSNWDNAYTTLGAAINRANTDASVKEIRVHAGTYQEAEFIVSGNYTISGAWNRGTGNQDPWTAPTVLDGQVQHRVMKIEGGAQVKLYMLHFINGGYPNPSTNENGGNIYNRGTLTMEQCSVRQGFLAYTATSAYSHGGGMYNEGKASITSSDFAGNVSCQSGGAITNAANAFLTITGCQLTDNLVDEYGGAIANAGVLKVYKSRFTNNIIRLQGGPTYHNGGGGAVAHRGGNGEEIFVGCIFDKNKAINGGGLYVGGNAFIVNCTFYRNESNQHTSLPGLGAAIHSYGSVGPLIICNNVFQNNVSRLDAEIFMSAMSSGNTDTKVIRNNCLLDGHFYIPDYTDRYPDMANNIILPAFLLNPENGDFSIPAFSFAVDKGSNDYYAGNDYPGSDYLGQLRISPCTIDIGAVEFQQVTLNPIKPDNNGILYVSLSSSYNGPAEQGSSWVKALRSLKSAIDYANICPAVIEIRVTGGLYNETNLSLTRACYIRGGYNASTGEQNWSTNLTILQSAVNDRVLYTKSDNGFARVEGCWIRNGRSSSSGGGIYNEGNLQLSYCKILFNYAPTGGGVANRGTLRVINCEFVQNTADMGAGAYNFNAATFTNCSFSENIATTSGNALQSSGVSQTNLNNNILWGTGLISQVMNYGTLVLDRNIIRGVAGSNITHVTDAATDQAVADPKFWSITDLTFQAGSPAINKGKNELYEAGDGNAGNNSLGEDKDYGSAIRNFDNTIDLGAHERQAKQQTVTVTDLTAMYGDAPLVPGATSNSPATINYQSQQNNIAEPFTDTDGKVKLRIRNKGTILVNAFQNATGVYDPSPVVTFTLTIAPKPVTITANDLSKTYGDADPVFTYSVSPALVAGDAFSNELRRATGENIGTYAIEQGPLTLSDNYAITYVGADFTINTKTITVTADAQNKIYGDDDPELTYTYTPLLVGTDVFENALTRVAGENAGTYAVEQGSLGLNSNYTLNFVTNDLVINKKAISVAAANKSKTYGATDPAFTYTITPALINNDVLTGALTRTSGEDAGQYDINLGNLGHQNYAITYTKGLLTINKANQLITWNQALVSDCNGNAVLTLNATSSSGLTVVYQSSNAAIASINADQLTFVTPGLATITAAQAGDNNFLPATEVQNDLTSRLPAHLIMRHWDDVLLFDNTSKQYTAWQWYKNDQPVNGATGQYFYESGKLNGNYYATAKNAAGVVLPACPTTFTPGSYSAPLSVVPNPVGAGQTVTVKTNLNATQLLGASIAVISIQGVELGVTQNVQPQTTITMPALQGLYVVKLRLANGAVYATNVLVKP